jgi:hypothetical protein
MKKEEAERMLRAIDNQEKNTLNKMKKVQAVKGSKQTKDW